eukprot:g26187.t1
MLWLYRTLVRPLLEYCMQFWSPYDRNDVVKLGMVQKRIIRILPVLEGLSFCERLNRLELFYLEHWRLGDDFMEVYEIMRGMDR